jgi:hypothetical protein
VDLEITPEPSEEERAAIAKALAYEADQHPVSPWLRQVLPQRDAEEA